ncbi:hypothetical protein K503DRAFT_862421 [Rhizopogon vinicolor AM-OR11-026]|uniref:F-box domain-containing protein n=1 Tax=Rhizopogon vinicolor AM-OR11-026 TaxID=1314800 RepID=A0A1B7NEH8_9AGAM|nr:hypothetical protein K503DRAFT_862421 [Rhizopogon vinicolor AM-OR11-026]
MIHSVALGLVDLPVDTLFYILVYFDVYDLVRARRICNTLRRVIDFSEKLLYAIDLKYYQIIPLPGSVSSIATRRRLLRHSETAWQKAEYSQRCRIPFPYPGAHHRWSCGVLGIMNPNEIKFIQPPPSASDHTDTTAAIDGPSEDHDYEVSFRSLSEDKVHPDAASAVLKVPDAQAQVDFELLHYSDVEGKLFEDYFGLICKNVRSDGAAVDVLQVWKWKGLVSEDGTTDFCLIANDRLLIVNTYGELMLYSLIGPPIDPPNAIQLIAKFSLPHCQASPCSRLIAIYVDVFPAWGRDRGCRLYIGQNTFLELESTYTNLYGIATQDSRALSWSAWGPEYTRLFSGSLDGYSNDWHSSHGFRTVELIGDIRSSEGPLHPRQLCIRDFNLHRTIHYKARNRTKGYERLVEGGPPNLDTHNHLLTDDLPYLEITTQEKFLASGIEFMDKSGVFLSLVNEDRVVDSIEVLYFR